MERSGLRGAGVECLEKLGPGDKHMSSEIKHAGKNASSQVKILQSTFYFLQHLKIQFSKNEQ